MLVSASGSLPSIASAAAAGAEISTPQQYQHYQYQYYQLQQQRLHYQNQHQHQHQHQQQQQQQQQSQHQQQQQLRHIIAVPPMPMPAVAPRPFPLSFSYPPAHSVFSTIPPLSNAPIPSPLSASTSDGPTRRPSNVMSVASFVDDDTNFIDIPLKSTGNQLSPDRPNNFSAMDLDTYQGTEESEASGEIAVAADESP
ncbi:hypothetical protein HK100_003707, partial [Physocladia obscura]